MGAECEVKYGMQRVSRLIRTSGGVFYSFFYTIFIARKAHRTQNVPIGAFPVVVGLFVQPVQAWKHKPFE